MAEETKVLTVTEEGLKKLQDDLAYLVNVKRPEVTKNIGIARGFGDLSENSEYDEARESQAKNEHRILELEEMLKHVVVIDENAANSNRVTLGKAVKVRNEKTGNEVVYNIVGPTETDPFAHRISDVSPIGMALMGKVAGDKATAETPKGSVDFTILEITKA